MEYWNQYNYQLFIGLFLFAIGLALMALFVLNEHKKRKQKPKHQDRYHLVVAYGAQWVPLEGLNGTYDAMLALAKSSAKASVNSTAIFGVAVVDHSTGEFRTVVQIAAKGE